MTTPAPSSSSDPSAPIALRDSETIAFIGDSITEQNLYSAFIETFLMSRLPGKDLRFHNFGWGGDTAPGGAGRFARDVAPIAPSLVLVKFGMNDGRYSAPDEAVRGIYLDGQRALADAIAAMGARQVAISPNPIDVGGRAYLEPYNATLKLFSEHLRRMCDERGIAFIDLFAPVLAVQERAQRATPGFTMIPDGVHPNEVGHFVMAHAALERFAAPRGLGDIVVDGDGVTASGPAKVANTARAGAELSFDLTVPFQPYFVPEPARPALALVPFQERFNRFRLDCSRWKTGRALSVRVGGVEIALIGREDGEGGIDLAALDAAPWSASGRALWNLAQQRWRVHLQAWRELGILAGDEIRALPSLPVLNRAMKDFVREQGAAMRSLVGPSIYRVTIAETDDVAIPCGELSPLYPFDPAKPEDFETAHAPETAPDSVPWRSVRFNGHALDLGAHQGNPTKCVCYVRLVFEASASCRVRLLLGSDDGISVFVDGRRILARNVTRGCRLGDDSVDAHLGRGRTTILLRVTQAGGGYGVAIRAQSLDGADVRLITV